MGLQYSLHTPSRMWSIVMMLTLVLAMTIPTMAAPPTAPAARTQASPADQIRTLIQSVDAAVASGEIDSATLGAQLKAHLQTAADAAASGKKGAAGVALTAFIKDVNTQAKHIKSGAAGKMTEAAELTKQTLLGTPPFQIPSPSHGSSSGIRPADNGVLITNDCSVPAPVANVKLGDVVNMQIWLSTNDADEAGEGEAVFIYAPGVPPASFATYGGVSSYDLTVKAEGTITACLDIPNGELLGLDHAAEIDIHINSPAIRPITDTVKKAFAVYAVYQSAASATLVIAAAVTSVPQPEVSAACALGAGVASAVSAIAGGIALDPSDPNYTVIVQPTFAKVSQQPLHAHGALDQAEANAFNALWTNEEAIIGYGNAIQVSVNRAQGAHDANDMINQNKQLQAAQQFAANMSSAINAEPGLYANLKSALNAGGISLQSIKAASFTFDESNVMDFEAGISTNGLPPTITQALTDLGISPVQQGQIAMQLLAQDTAAVAKLGGGSFPEALTDPTFVSAQQQAATTLMQFATNPITLILPTNPPTPPITSNLQFFPLSAPVRLLDTRAGQSACYKPGTPLGANKNLSLNVRIVCTGLPNEALAIVGNATVVNNATNAPPGFVTLFPSSATLPTASNLNYVPGDVVPNAFTVGLGGDGAFKIYATGAIDFVVDITGYYAPPGSGGLFFHPLAAPVRLLDTRSGAKACNTPATPLKAKTALNLVTDPTCVGVPRGAIAVVGNATVINNTQNTPPGFVTLYPGGVPLPLASNLNYVSGQVIPNAFTVGLGTDRSFNLYATTGIDAVVDITGYYDTQGANGLTYTSLAAPVRLLDTRPGGTGCNKPGKPLTANGPLALNARTTCTGIPAAAGAVIGNGTVVNDTGVGPGYVTFYPNGADAPVASNLNYVSGQVVPNAFVVGLASDGTFNTIASTGVDIVIDIAGYFS